MSKKDVRLCWPSSVSESRAYEDERRQLKAAVKAATANANAEALTATLAREKRILVAIKMLVVLLAVMMTWWYAVRLSR